MVKVLPDSTHWRRLIPSGTRQCGIAGRLGDNLSACFMPAELTVGTRISRRFAELKARGEMGIIAYITAGDPSLAASLKFVTALAEAGTDVIELGVPFSDPLADGPTIQRAS